MSQASIAAIAKIIQEVLNHQEPIDASSDAQSVSGWDSLNHMMIIAAVEKHFEINFSLDEVMGLENVGQMAELVDQKLA